MIRAHRLWFLDEGWSLQHDAPQIRLYIAGWFARLLNFCFEIPYAERPQDTIDGYPVGKALSEVASSEVASPPPANVYGSGQPFDLGVEGCSAPRKARKPAAKKSFRGKKPAKKPVKKAGR